MMKTVTLFIGLMISPFMFDGQLYANTIEQDNINQKDEQGRKQGKWIILGKDKPSKGYPDENKIEEGNYNNDRKDGKWIMYYPDGTVKLEGEFKNGRPKGEYVKYHSNGKKMEEGTFTGRKYVGTLKRYHENGNLAQDMTFNDEGKTDGPVIYYHENGNKEFEFNTENGTEVGEATRWYKNGDVKEKIVYSNGKVTSSEEKERVNPEYKEKDSNTKDAPKMDEGITNAAQKKVKDGYNKLYNKNQELWMDGEFKDGKLWNGKLYIYDEDGILMKIEIYKKGKYFSDGVL